VSNPWFAENLDGFVREEFENLSAQRPDAALYERLRQRAVGEPIDIEYSDDDYSGSGSLVWTVLPRHVNTAAYDLVGMRMKIALYLTTFSVSGTGNALRFKIPGGFKARYTMFSHSARIIDNGTATDGAIGSTADSNILSISRTDAANFAASTDNSSLQVDFSFWVKSQAV
jgi:hypothetical protein